MNLDLSSIFFFPPTMFTYLSPFSGPCLYCIVLWDGMGWRLSSQYGNSQPTAPGRRRNWEDISLWGGFPGNPCISLYKKDNKITDAPHGRSEDGCLGGHTVSSGWEAVARHPYVSQCVCVHIYVCACLHPHVWHAGPLLSLCLVL